jgi:parallel beta-helix repeat protein
VAASGGNDANSCATAQTITTPKLTVAGGLSCLTAAGDTLYIRTGTYADRIFEVDLPVSGQAGSRITISNYDNEVVSLKLTSQLVRFQDNTRHHVTINGVFLDATGYADTAIYLGDSYAGGPDSTDITFSNVEVTAAGHCILAGGFNHQFLNMNVHHCGTGPGHTDIQGNAIYGQSLQNSIIDGGTYHHNLCTGIRLWNSGASPKANNTIVRNVRAYENGNAHGAAHDSNCSSGGSGINPGDTNMSLYNNLIYNNWWGIDVQKGSGHTIYNNTLYNNDYTLNMQGSGTVRNNILYGGNAPGISGSATASNNTTSNPNVVNAGTFDFRLQAGSPAIDAGINLSAVPYDFSHVSRPQGAGFDIGAHESVGSGGDTAPPAAPRNLQVQ